ncbi:unnamed protein product, partial [marine sediment metagenome]
MKVSIKVVDNVILRSFKGDVSYQDILNSWDDILAKFEDLTAYNGLISDFLEADMHHEDKNLNELVDFLKNHLDKISGMKLAIVMDTPHVTRTIMMDQKMKSLHIRPFTTRQSAF